MGLLSSIYTSISGLCASANGLSVIGDNIANLNTVGFKSSRISFCDIYGSEIDRIGKGSYLHTATMQFSQGPIDTSDNPLDLAINGNGFFIVKDSDTDKEYYTRAGTFSIQNPTPDKAYIVNPDGLRLRGYAADTAGNIVKTLTDVEIPLVQDVDDAGKTVYVPKMQARATSTATIQANLNASPAEPVYAPGTLLDPLDPTKGPAAGTFNHSIAMTVYDSVGNTHAVEIYFKKTGVNPGVSTTWDAHVIWNSGKTIPYYHEQIISNLTFNTDGNMTSPSAPVPVTLTWDPAWGAGTSQQITIDLTGSTQYGSPYSTIFQEVDGYPEGGLMSFRLDRDGILYGLYSNGQSKRFAQIALAKFNAQTELNKIGQNLFAETSEAGTRNIITADMKSRTNNQGIKEYSREVDILSNSIEMSNVDLAEEFVTMMMLQKAYNANGVALSTSLEMLKKWDEI